VRLNPGDAAAVRLLQLINDLFAIDAEARDQNVAEATRNAMRQERAPLLLAQIKEQMEEAKRTALPKSCFGKACRYTLKLWEKLTRFLEHPHLELSNNLAENSMRARPWTAQLDPPWGREGRPEVTCDLRYTTGLREELLGRCRCMCPLAALPARGDTRHVAVEVELQESGGLVPRSADACTWLWDSGVAPSADVLGQMAGGRHERAMR